MDLRVDGGWLGEGANQYARDRNGRPLTIRDDNGHTTTYNYDDLDRPVSHTYADGITYQYTYDRNGIPTSRRDANGSLVNLTYDELNRPTQLDVERGPQVGGTTVQSFTYDGLGRIRLATDDNDPGGREITLDYDPLNRLDTVRQAGEAAAIADYDYIGPYHVLRRAYGNGTRLDLGYDEAWRGTSVTLSRIGDGTLLAGLGYDFDRAYLLSKAGR